MGLVAPGVVNEGTIQARLGRVALASANRFRLDLRSDRVVRVAVDDSVLERVMDHRTEKSLKHLVENRGTIEAAGGQVALSAAATRLVLDSVIDSSGTVLAPTVEKQVGAIWFSTAFPDRRKTPALPRQKARVAGRLEVSGRGEG